MATRWLYAFSIISTTVLLLYNADRTTSSSLEINTLAPPLVQVEQGLLRGKIVETLKQRRVAAFYGVPYARPPIGQLRFKEPQAPEPWDGVYDASEKSSPCIQYGHFIYKSPDPTRGTEDCLTINIFTPKISNSSQHQNLDVIVFIHGGAFMYGTGNNFGPDYLLDKEDVVLVTINYRVGILGFLSTEDEVLPGNNGLKDQSQALKWIKNNIAAFGGDPLKVTIAGLSAGGASVHYHILSPLSKGLFSKGISGSGTAFCSWTLTENSRAKAQKVASLLGCPTEEGSETMVKCLRQRPATRLVLTTKHFQPWLYNPYSPFGPVVEPPGPNAFISEQAIDIMFNKKASDVPWLTTFENGEGLYPACEFIDKGPFCKELDQRWTEIAPHLLDFNFTLPADKHANVSLSVKQFYLKGKPAAENIEGLTRMLSDRLFLTCIVKSSKMYASLFTSPVRSYLFSYAGKTSTCDVFKYRRNNRDLAAHGDDVQYIFSIPLFPTHEDPKFDEISTKMIGTWMKFIRGKDLESWPTVDANLPNYTYINIGDGTKDGVVIKEDLANEQFWDKIKLNENVPSILKDELR